VCSKSAMPPTPGLGELIVLRLRILRSPPVPVADRAAVQRRSVWRGGGVLSALRPAVIAGRALAGADAAGGVTAAAS